ncbi:MAG: hypothetical protein ACUVWV_14740 [Thermodesulfobacteriota bacterium]
MEDLGALNRVEKVVRGVNLGFCLVNRFSLGMTRGLLKAVCLISARQLNKDNIALSLNSSCI